MSTWPSVDLLWRRITVVTTIVTARPYCSYPASMAMQVTAYSAATVTHVIMCHVIGWDAWKAHWEVGRGAEGVQLHAAAALYYEDGRPFES